MTGLIGVLPPLGSHEVGLERVENFDDVVVLLPPSKEASPAKIAYKQVISDDEDL